MLIEFLLAAPAFAALILSSFLALEVIASLLPLRPINAQSPDRIAAVVPAHNEGAAMTLTLNDLKAQLRPQDRLLVVADNCTDDTADVARAMGVECIERHDPDRRGKGYAIQAAISHLRGDPPAVVYFIDADCRVDPDAVQRVVAAAHGERRPAQGLTLMHAPESGAPAMRVAEFAWLVMNRVRMGGLFRLFDVARLTGTGMAFPWSVVAENDLATGDIVEDLSLSLRLCEQGHAPVFVPDAVIRGSFPVSDDAAMKQRARWEHGSLDLSQRRSFMLLKRGVLKGDGRLMALALDVMLPPVVLLGLLLAFLFLLASIALLLGAEAPFFLAAAAVLIFASAIAIAWMRWGRHILPLSSAGKFVDYVLFKRRVYSAQAKHSTKTWTRTERDDRGNGDAV